MKTFSVRLQLPPPPEMEDILPAIAPETWFERLADAYDWWWIPLGLALLAIGVAAGWFLRRRRPAPSPPTAREIAALRLESLRQRASKTGCYDFAILVSDALRTFYLDAFGVPATMRTSIEFLQELSGQPVFTKAEIHTLDGFLSVVDRIKFGGASTSASPENAALLAAAAAIISPAASRRSSQANVSERVAG